MRNHLGVIVCSCIVGLLASCSSAPVATESSNRALKPVTCVAVLPSTAGESEEVSRIGGNPDNVGAGAAYADTVIRQELAANPKARLVQANDMASLSTSLTEASAATGCEAVMVTSIYKFRQRVGSTMAVDEPASTAFDLRVYDAQTKHVLWASDFSETQEPLLSNIFSFGKAQRRGFKWITVEELLAEGLKERLAACPYLQSQ